MKITVDRFDPVPPAIESVTIVLSEVEARRLMKLTGQMCIIHSESCLHVSNIFTTEAYDVKAVTDNLFRQLTLELK